MSPQIAKWSRSLFAAPAAIVLLTGTAFADCDVSIEGFDRVVNENRAYTEFISPSMRKNLGKLREASAILKNMGQEDACEEVVEVIQDRIEEVGEKTEARAEDRARAQRRMAELQSAMSVDQLVGQLRANEIIGTNVRNLSGEDFGEVEDVVVGADSESRSYAILSHGGFLGLGEKMVAVPLDRMKVTQNRDIFVLDVSEERLEGAPRFKTDDVTSLTNPDWRRATELYFDQSPANQGNAPSKG